MSERPSSTSVAEPFPSPPQPHFIRAQQKDELYLQQLTEACHDAVRRVLGPRGALRWASETRALAQLLYYALTTGAGLQTLGEEYCDMVQVTGPLGSAALPGLPRRGLLVLLQALGPYLADRLATGGGDDEDDGFAAWQAAQAAAQRERHAAQHAAQREQRAAEQQAKPVPPQRLLLRRLAAAAQQLAGEGRRLAAAAAARPLLSQRLPAAAAFLRAHGATLLRVHLALFYIFGVFYQPSKRATGVRYVFLGHSLEGRPSYHVLGLLLCTQLGISGLQWVARRYGTAANPLAALLTGGGGAAQGAAGGRRHAALLSHDGKLLGEGGEWPAAGEGVAAAATPGGEVAAGRRKCPLCLSTRAHPTATPCGHVFCWQCITEWGAQKPECPLCRAEFAPSSLICLHHADF